MTTRDINTATVDGVMTKVNLRVVDDLNVMVLYLFTVTGRGKNLQKAFLPYNHSTNGIEIKTQRT